MPKILDKKSQKKQASLMQEVQAKNNLKQSLKMSSYDEGVAALGFDPNDLGEDPQTLGMDVARLADDLSANLKDLQLCYEPFLRTQRAASLVGPAYRSTTSTTEQGGADFGFKLELYQLTDIAINACKAADFYKKKDLGSRRKMSKVELRQCAAQAQALLNELERFIAAMTMIAARVMSSPTSTYEMWMCMTRILEARSEVSWIQRTFRTEGFEATSAGTKKAGFDPPSPAQRAKGGADTDTKARKVKGAKAVAQGET